MSYAIELLAALLGSLGFSALYNLHGIKLLFASLGGLFAWTVYLLVGCWTENVYICAFIASAALTLYAEFMARKQKTPVTVFLVTAAIPLIPGAGLYRTINCLMLRMNERAAAEGLYKLLFAVSMSAGITLTTLVCQIVRKALSNQNPNP